MKSLILKYATPLTATFFLVSLISGVSLFIHAGPSAMHGIHEWLSMVLVAPIMFHVLRNWRAFSSYFKHVPMVVAFGIASAATGLFFIPATVPTGSKDGPPQFALASVVLENSVASVAPILGKTPDTLVAELNAAGFPATPEARLSDLPAKSQKTDRDLLRALLP